MSFPNYIQLDAMDCGAVCLQIISKYYGSYFSQQRLRELYHITRNGVSLLGIGEWKVWVSDSGEGLLEYSVHSLIWDGYKFIPVAEYTDHLLNIPIWIKSFLLIK